MVDIFLFEILRGCPKALQNALLITIQNYPPKTFQYIVFLLIVCKPVINLKFQLPNASIHVLAFH